MGVGTKIVSETLGHSTTRISGDLCQQVSVQTEAGAEESVLGLLPERKRKSGS